MKTKFIIVSILFLFLSIALTSCEADENLSDATPEKIEVNGVDKDVDRPGSQG